MLFLSTTSTSLLIGDSDEIVICSFYCFWSTNPTNFGLVFSLFHCLLTVRGAFNKFPDFFFVQAFKIVVDTWKFTMLLLYILWDDWPIFMISGSNEQLQQQLEYTLLKPHWSQLVSFKNAIWTWGHFRRMICDEILF